MLQEDDKQELLSTVQEEADRLNRFIANLLDMTKLESGALEPNATLYDASEVVGSVLQRANKILQQHHVEVEIAGTFPC